MNFFEKIIYGLTLKMPEPTVFGVYHIISLLVVIGLTALVCWKCKDCSARALKWIVASAWIVMLVLEIYKNIALSFEYDGTKVVWDYPWHIFPFQLCSMPLYIYPIIAFKKDGKFRDALIAFASTFVFFGGLATMIMPATVFTEIIGINIQTMVHHGAQIVIGVLLLVHERKRLNLKFFIPAIYVFGVALSVAMAMNLIFPTFVSETFNMFYISPYYSCILPLLEIVYAQTHYAVFLIIYILGFILIAFLMYIIQYYIIKACMNRRKKAVNKNE